MAYRDRSQGFAFILSNDELKRQIKNKIKQTHDIPCPSISENTNSETVAPQTHLNPREQHEPINEKIRQVQEKLDGLQKLQHRLQQILVELSKSVPHSKRKEKK